LISTESVENYWDGYRVHIQIGNPTAADIVSYDLVYNIYNSTNFFDTSRIITNSMVNTLFKGKWNDVDFVVAPASADELRNLSVRINVHTVSLTTP
jgi:hypothetical protein